MKCNEMKARLIPFLYRDLTDEENTRVEDHLAKCARCKHEWQSMHGVVQMCAQWKEEPVAKDYARNTLMKTKPEILTPEELALFFRVSVADVMDGLDDIPHIRIGKSVRFRRETIMKWLEETEHRIKKEEFGQQLSWISLASRMKDVVIDQEE